MALSGISKPYIDGVRGSTPVETSRYMTWRRVTPSSWLSAICRAQLDLFAPHRTRYFHGRRFRRRPAAGGATALVPVLGGALLYMLT